MLSDKHMFMLANVIAFCISVFSCSFLLSRVFVKSPDADSPAIYDYADIASEFFDQELYLQKYDTVNEITSSNIGKEIQENYINPQNDIVNTEVVEKESDLKYYITQKGEKYHKSNCSHIKNREAKEVSLKELELLGKTPCGVCKPQSYK